MTKELVSLTTLDRAKELIASATVAQLKEIINQADALRVYAAQAKKGLEIQNQCAEIKLRAERKIGEELKRMPKNKGAATPTRSQDVTASLKDLGIEKMQSFRWQAAAELTDKEFEKHVKEVKDSNEELTTVGVIKLARILHPKEVKPTPPLPTGKYQVIYADPPWLYGQDQHGKEEQATVLSTHYPSMPTPEIADLPITDLVSDNAVLFLWVTSPKLFEAKSIIDAWSFTYKTSMVWDKVKHNVGYYVSVRHEILLICTKGSFLPESGKLVDSVQSIERTEHSKKPERFYEIIEEMYPSAKKLELFSRNKRAGWKSWGNEV